MNSHLKQVHLHSLILLTCVLLMTIPSASGLAQGEGPVYIVQPGDTLSQIARRLGASVEDLAARNGIADPSRITPGMELIIPGFEGVEGRLRFEEVQVGELFEMAAMEFGLDADTLTRLNRISRPDALYAGQTLVVLEREDGQADSLPGRMVLPKPGETSLELAARLGRSPWGFMPMGGGPFERWTIVGEPLLDAASADAAAVFPAPIQDVAIRPLPLVQGLTTVFRVQAPGLLVEGKLGERVLAFFPDDDGSFVSLQGVHAMAEPGLVPLSLRFIDTASGEILYAFRQPLLLEEGGYPFRVLNGVPPETIDLDVIEPEEALISDLLAKVTPEKYWQGPFDYPSRYYTEEFVALFGTRRSYNNGAYLSYHAGVDFYGRDTPIYAPANGRVVFAGPLTVRGNATYIDHGWGVYSGYLHQAEIYVSEGEWVERGQVIGKVGGTGRVTGPHLHWEIWAGGVPVEPLSWVQAGYP